MSDTRSPSTISGLVGWYTGLSAEVTNGSVSSWKDISGQGNHVTTIRGSPKVDRIPPIENILAFHYGNFDNHYGDGTRANAAAAGRIYADTPPSEIPEEFGSLASTASTTNGQTTYNWNPPGSMSSIDTLIVAGGGTGGNNTSNGADYENGGGGGGGGVVSETGKAISGPQTIVVGQGGIIPPGFGQNTGKNTTAFGYTALGGGGGSTRDSQTNINGGSGGGACNYNPYSVRGIATQPGSASGGYGNNGGTATSYASGLGGSGGGGGAGESGFNGGGTVGARGGNGLLVSKFNEIYGENGYFGAGGGGGGGTGGVGGVGGGGRGGSSSSINGINGTNHTGGGGGGNFAWLGFAGNGGSGIVLVRPGSVTNEYDTATGLAQFPFLYGISEDGMRFPTTVMNVNSPNYTLFHVTKYLTTISDSIQIFDDQHPNTPFTGTLSGNSVNGPSTRITSSSGGGYIELSHGANSSIGTVYWQLTSSDSWEVDGEIYVQPVSYGGADDIRFVFYAPNPLTITSQATGTGGHGGHSIMWEYYEGDTVLLRNASEVNLTSANTSLVMNQWMPIKVTYTNGQFTATIKNSSGGILNTTTYNFGTTFSSFHNQPMYFGFTGRSGGVYAIDRVRNITFTSLGQSSVSSRKRIFDGLGNNWLSGFHQNAVGGAYHDGTGWITPQSDLHGVDWVMSTDQRNMYRSNGTNRTTATYTNSKSTQLTINYGQNVATESSNWAVAEVIVFNRELTSSEYISVEGYLNTKYFGDKGLPVTGVISGSLINANFYRGTDGGYPLSIARLGERFGIIYGTIIRASDFRLAGALANIPTPAAAYSVRKLFFSYTGPQVRIKRSTDNVQANIYMDNFGNITNIEGSSEINLTTWLGGATAYVTIWYDQSGNGRHTTAYGTSATTFPSLSLQGERYVIYFPGTSTTSGGYFNSGSFTFNIGTNGGISTFSRVNFLGGDKWERVYDYASGSPNNNVLFARMETTQNTRFEVFQGSSGTRIDLTNVITNNTWHSFGNRMSGSGTNWTFTIRKDGSQVGTTTTSISLGDRTITNSYIGRSQWGGDNYSNMYLSDQIFFNTGLVTDTHFAIMENALV
jgi:hypothetical protein